MNNFEIERSLETMRLLIDTREQPTERYERRIKQIGLPHERRKLNYGDYACECTLPDGSTLDFSNRVVIERKMNLDEVCMCYGKERKRFEREFERAKEDGCKVYLLIEGGNWEKSYGGKYRSLLNPAALTASLNAFRARYGMQLDFCKEETTGKLIHDILYRELKEYLQNEFGRD